MKVRLIQGLPEGSLGIVSVVSVVSVVSAILTPERPFPVVMIAIMISLEFPAEFLTATELTAVVIIVTIPTTVTGIMVVDELRLFLVPLASTPPVTVVSFIGERKGRHSKGYDYCADYCSDGNATFLEY